MKRTVLILLVSSFTIGAIAQDHDGRRKGNRDHRGQHEGRHSKGLALLDLTDAQKEQMKTMRIDHEKAIKSDQQDLKLKMVELGNLVSNDNPNKKRIQTLTDEIGDLQTSLLKAKVNHRIEVRAILDDEQKLKFDKMKLGLEHMKRGRI